MDSEQKAIILTLASIIVGISALVSEGIQSLLTSPLSYIYCALPYFILH